MKARHSPQLGQLFGRKESMRNIMAADVDTAPATYPERFSFFASGMRA